MRYHLLTALLLLFSLQGYAAEKLLKSEYRLLTEAHKLMEEGQLDKAYEHLIGAKDKVRGDYARALVQHNLGHIELQRDNYREALDYLTKAYSYGELQEEQHTNLTHTLAQLNCMEEQWRMGIDYLQKWISMVPSEKVKDTDFVLLAQAHSQLENWQKVIEPIDIALSRRAVPPENWYQLKIVAHVRLKQWRDAINAQKNMLSHYPGKAENWRQLVSMQLHIDAAKQALSTQRMGYEHGILREGKDYKLLAQLMLQAEIPYYAGQVLEAGIEQGVLKEDRKMLKLLSGSWAQAKEHGKAVDALAKLNQIAPSRETLEQQAQMHIELEQWQSAKKTIKRALQFEGKKERLQLLLGITEINLQRFDNARRALVAAAADSSLKSSAEGWMRYLEQVGSTESTQSEEG